MKRSLHLRSAGFTLLEIMLVVMIIALLAGSAIYMMGGNIGVAKDGRVDTDIQTLKTQLMVYEASVGHAPSTEEGLKALMTPPSPKPRNWKKLMDKMVLDPYGREYHYAQPGAHNPDSFDLFSAGKDGIVGTADDRGNWDSQ